MTKDFNTDYVLALFQQGFGEAYQQANKQRRRQVLPYSNALFRRWYHAALIEHSTLTPANIIEAMLLHSGGDIDVYPTVQQNNVKKFSGFHFPVLAYDMHSHPVVGDMGELMRFCSPSVDLNEDERFYESASLELAPRLSQPDPNYALYLLDVAIQMKLLLPMPALYVCKVQPARNWESRLQGPPHTVLQEIIQASIAMAAYQMQHIIALPEALFTESYLRHMLTNPIETDALFARVYEEIGYTLEDLLSLSANIEGVDTDTPDGAFLASTFVLGVVLDQCFYTPFGHYLKLIRPLYVLPYDLTAEMDEFTRSAVMDLDAVFYAPCSSYTLTRLGLQCMQVEPTDTNHFDAVQRIPMALLQQALHLTPDLYEALAWLAPRIPPPPDEAQRTAYSFLVRREDIPAQWMHVHFPVHASLHQVYETLAGLFDITLTGDYSFYHDKTENRFAEYPCPRRANKGKKSAEAALHSLDFDHQPHLLLAAHQPTTPFFEGGPTRRLALEMKGTRPMNYFETYPLVTRVSKAYKQFVDKEFTHD